MFFIASKLLWIIAAPTNVLMLMGGLGLVLLFTRFQRSGRGLVAVALVGMFVFGVTPLPRLMARTLEDRFPIYHDNGARIDGIVVLGGAVGISRGQVRFNDAGARMTEAVALARRHPEAKIVFTGGQANLIVGERYTEADAARDLFRAMGLPDERVIYEGASRNTHENATLTAALVKPKPGENWLLLTSAYHTPRAIGCFRQVGFAAKAYPVDFHTDGNALDLLRPFREWSLGLRLTDLVVKEWMGLIAYRLAGYTDAVLPAPKA